MLGKLLHRTDVLDVLKVHPVTIIKYARYLVKFLLANNYTIHRSQCIIMILNVLPDANRMPARRITAA
ncbi:MAG: hypothetical protein ABSE42_08585 [Bryobacteraceae bacterium]|jgi:hypothetical protein